MNPVMRILLRGQGKRFAHIFSTVKLKQQHTQSAWHGPRDDWVSYYLENKASMGINSLPSSFLVIIQPIMS